MHDDEVEVDEVLVRHLLATQLPQFAEQPLTVIEPWGTDNAIWRLGDDLVVRLPRIHWAVDQIELEATWLPHLSPRLPVAVPEPVAVGHPDGHYPYPWAVHRWIPGDSAAPVRIDDHVEFARDLAETVAKLQAAPIQGAPSPRGRARPLHDYDDASRQAIDGAGDLIDVDAALAVWEEALQAPPYARAADRGTILAQARRARCHVHRSLVTGDRGARLSGIIRRCYRIPLR